MESRVEDRSPQAEASDDAPKNEQRWQSLLEKVVSEQQTDDPWYVKLGVSLAWSAAIAAGMSVVAAIVLGLRALISANVQFTFRSLSDHIFWGAAVVMIAGMISPSAAEMELSRDRKKKQERPQSLQERRERSLERRLRRVYDPWRWRIWGGAALTFGVAILSGVLARS